MPLDAVVLMEIDPEVLLRRLAGRRSCRRCGRVFHIETNPPKPGELCTDGRPHDLFQRPDDNETTVRERLAVYCERTQPLIDYYARKGLLRRIDANGTLDEVERRGSRPRSRLNCRAADVAQLERREQRLADDFPAPAAEDRQFAFAAQERHQVAPRRQHFRLDLRVLPRSCAAVSAGP